MKKFELLGATAIALFAAAPAFAQNTEAAPQAAQESEEDTSSSEIIVTATLRSEKPERLVTGSLAVWSPR